MKIAISLFAIFFIVCFIFIFFFKRFEPEYKTTELYSNRGEKLYIKRKIYGIKGDIQITSISTVKGWDELDETKEYVYKGLEPFIYSYQNDTLRVYSRQRVKTPANFHSTIRIIQIELENPQYMDLMYKAISVDTALFRI